ncbi:MAG: hypothetical protein CMF69_11300 [Magnetovibrio sp.]|nr:hypothetical protein [Magnetovibrio sp.]
MSSLLSAITGISLVPLLLSGVPIAFSILATCLIYMGIQGMDPSTPGSTMFWFLNSSSLVSIPFFILAAEILSRSGATDALVGASNALFGRVRNGLALVTVISVLVFSAISGSSVATAVAIGRVMIPKLIENGYKQRFAIGLVAASGGLGILIPPSVPLIVYAAVVEISIGDLFMAAMLPGLMLGLMLCIFVVGLVDSVRSHYPETSILSDTLQSRRQAIIKGIPMFLFPVVVLGGIYTGIFTPTEAAAVSVFLSLFLSITIYKNTNFKALIDVFARAGSMSATILIIMAATSVLSFILSYERVPNQVTEMIATLDISPLIFLLMVNLLLLVMGCFLEIISVILIIVPIILPTLQQLAIDPIHFGIILIINMELAVITPPIGMNLFVVSAISNQPIGRVFQGAIPFVGIIALGLLAIVLIPAITTVFID